MAEPKALVTRGFLAVVAALALSAVLFVYAGNVPILTEMEARSAYLAGEGPPPPKASETTVTVTAAQGFRGGVSATTVTVYTTLAEGVAVGTEDGKTLMPVTTVTRTVTVNVTVTVTKTP